MTTLRILLATAALGLAATPAAAQTRDSNANVSLAILDECLAAARSGASFEAALTRRGFERGTTGAWVASVGNAVIAVSSSTNTVRGAPARLCAVTMTPRTADSAGLDAAVASRARSWNLSRLAPGPGNGGGTMSGWSNLGGTGLIAITINEAPGSGNVGPSTSVSAIWK